MLTRSSIDVFLNDKTLAIVGVSRNTKKFGHLVYKTLLENGYDLYPVNPNAEESDDIHWFRSIYNVPDYVKNILIITHKRYTLGVLKEAIEKGIKNIWIQQMSETPESIAFAIEYKVNLVSKQCIMMYANPKGIHKFHGNLMKFFGKYIK